jgi:PleD family two-component response regulator
MTPIEKLHQASILLVDDDETILDYVNNALLEQGYDVITATNGKEALQRINEAIPDLVVSDVVMPEMDGLSLLKALRSEKSTNSIPILLLTTKGSIKDKVEGLQLGADDYLTKPFDLEELMARVQSKIDRPPVPTEYLPQDRQTGLLSELNFSAEANLEIIRSSHGGKAGCLAIIQIFEIARLRERLGARAEREMAKQIADIIRKEAHPLDRIGHDDSGLFMLLLPDTDYEQANQKLKNLLNRIAEYQYLINGEQLRITPAIGYAVFQTEKSYDDVRGKAIDALEAWPKSLKYNIRER